MPAVLIEGGFMDSTTDIKALRNDAILKNAGIGVADGIAEFLGLKLRYVAPPAPKPIPKPIPPAVVEREEILTNDEVRRIRIAIKDIK